MAHFHLCKRMYAALLLYSIHYWDNALTLKFNNTIGTALICLPLFKVLVHRSCIFQVSYQTSFLYKIRCIEPFFCRNLSYQSLTFCFAYLNTFAILILSNFENFIIHIHIEGEKTLWQIMFTKTTI